MEAERQDGFMKKLIFRETKETMTELNDIIINKNDISENERENIKRLIALYQQTLEPIDDSSNHEPNNNFLSTLDILNIITHILKHKLDFSNRLNRARNILEQWQKTRAYKNEEFSIKFRENGNNYLRLGQLNTALHFYNEALLFGNLSII